MKKLISCLLALTMIFTMAACGNSDVKETQDPTDPAVVIESADKLLSAIWSDMTEDETYYVWGGDYNVMVEGDASLVSDEGFMTTTLHLPEELKGQVDHAASLIHGMNTNSMTSAAYCLAEGTDVAAFAKTLRDGIQSTQWMCGFPEQLYIATVGGYVLAVFGLTDNVSSIQNHFTSLYPTAEVLYSEAIEG